MTATESLPQQPPPRSPIPPAGTHATAATWWVRLAPLVPVALAGPLLVSWWSNRPTGGPGDVLTSVGQLTGLVTAVASLVTVALMARVPAVTDRLGADRMTRWHRWSATVTAVALPVHIACIVVGYAASDGIGWPSEVASLLTTYPDMLTATVGAGLIVVVTLTSVRAARRRLTYETWLFLHWYSYLAVLLAFGHQLSNGASFVEATRPDLLWTWLYVFVAGLVAWYRLVLPLYRYLRFPLTVAAVTPAGGGAVHVELTGTGLDRLAVTPGQHLRLRFWTRDAWWQSHPFSLSAPPTDDRLRITVAGEGDFTRSLATVPAGTRVLASGAYGDLTAGARHTDKVLLVAGGSGVTPLLALADSFPAGTDVQLLYRARSAPDLIGGPDLARLEQTGRAHVVELIGRRHDDPARDLLGPASLQAHVPDLAERDVYVCGHAGFVDAVTRSLRTLAVAPERIHTERFDP